MRHIIETIKVTSILCIVTFLFYKETLCTSAHLCIRACVGAGHVCVRVCVCVFVSSTHTTLLVFCHVIAKQSFSPLLFLQVYTKK